MKAGFKIMDSDMHIREPLDLWERYLDKRFQGRVPRLLPLRGSGIPLVLFDGKQITGAGMPRRPEPLPVVRARQQYQWSEDVLGFAKERSFDNRSQLQAMDMEGVDVAALFPSAPGLDIYCVPDMESPLYAAVCRAYNNWMYDFCQADPSRLKGAALVPLTDVNEAIQEARRARHELGFVSVYLRSAALPDQTWYPRYWEPFWAELEAMGMAVGFHESSGAGFYPQLERFPTGNRLMRHVGTHVMAQMVTMIDVIIGGVCERFPALRIGFLECNCGWAPSFLSRMDRHAGMLAVNDAPHLTMSPTEYFRRQCVIGAEGEERELPMVVQLLGDDNIVFSTDYPHSDSDFPHAVDEFLELPLPDESRRKIFWDNCARLYGLETTPTTVAAVGAASTSA